MPGPRGGMSLARFCQKQRRGEPQALLGLLSFPVQTQLLGDQALFLEYQRYFSAGVMAHTCLKTLSQGIKFLK